MVDDSPASEYARAFLSLTTPHQSGNDGDLAAHTRMTLGASRAASNDLPAEPRES
jgi:hypothetical protein